MTKEVAKHFSEVLKAYSEGKTIQYKEPNTNVWNDVVESDDLRYLMYRCLIRIKPEPKYRHYANAEEFLKAQKEHGHYLKGLSAVLIGQYHTPQSIDDGGVAWTNGGDVYSTYKDLFDAFTWQDGTPCGILEE